ncbi:hypothetical protein [Chryseobacterium sp. M5A1_1a]
MNLPIKIQRGNTVITLNFSTIEDRDEMVGAINNCIKNAKKYPKIDYRDKNDHIIFTSEILKNSLIVIPNPKP